MKNKLCNIDMSWKKIIIFAIFAGIYTGVINQVHFLEDTSFRDIAISYECWVFFATIIAINCKKPMESAIKVFVFFLISQSLVFIVELPMIGVQQALYYYKLWFLPIVFTFPGGFIAYFAKKDNLLGTLILSVATLFVGIHAVAYLLECYKNFPYHILTVIFCLFEIFILTKMLVKRAKFKALIYLITIIGMAVSCYMTVSSESIYNTYIPDGKWTVETKLDDKSNIVINEGSLAYHYKPFWVKDKTIVLRNENNATIKIEVKKEKNGDIKVFASNNLE